MCLIMSLVMSVVSVFFFFNDTATTEIYSYGHTLSLHDALPIWGHRDRGGGRLDGAARLQEVEQPLGRAGGPLDVAHHLGKGARSEEHTSELQSLMRISYAVFCLKKKTTLYN